MAKHRGDNSSWSLVEELFHRGDPTFVDELRQLADADRLGAFAGRWYGDQRPESRRLLLQYLDLPLNAYRHEPLVKRLFKLAESTGDDQAMGYFLAALDRSVRRRLRKRWAGSAGGMEEWLGVPAGTTMPRDKAGQYRNPRTGERISLETGRWPLFWKKIDPESEAEFRKQLEDFRLFSVHTRNYLRRRAWRYFRRLGREHPERYVPAITGALKLYTDADMADAVALLDNWALMHVLFHGSSAIQARPHGWAVAEGHTLAELSPAPIYEDLWKASPGALLELLRDARCRAVRQWAIRLIQRDHGSILSGLPADELLALLSHEDEQVVALAAEVMRNRSDLDTLPVDRWLKLLETPNVAALEILGELIARHVRPDRVTLEEAVRLTSSRPLPVARLGFRWIQGKHPTTEGECRALLGLVEAPCEPLRAEIVRSARGVLSASPYFQPEWVLEYLDSRHADVREEGWAWFKSEPRAGDNIEFWRKLMESPYDDVRFHLIADLDERVRKGDSSLGDDARLDPELLRLLWATVLLNIHRGNRVKPVVLGQMVRRVQRRPKEASHLLPLVSVALRSVRGPEWRAGLAGVVRMVESHPELGPVVRETFPELKL
jgi:hypothetical protein